MGDDVSGAHDECAFIAYVNEVRAEQSSAPCVHGPQHGGHSLLPPEIDHFFLEMFLIKFYVEATSHNFL